jgi:hypothetical protein
LLARRNCLELPDAAVCAFLLLTLIEGMRIDKRWMLTDAATLYKLDAESASSARPSTVLVGAIPCRSDRRKKSITHESNSGITIPRRFLELSFESLRTMGMQRTCSRSLPEIHYQHTKVDGRSKIYTWITRIAAEEAR